MVNQKITKVPPCFASNQYSNCGNQTLGTANLFGGTDTFGQRERVELFSG